MKDLLNYLNTEVKVTIDRPLGSIHPKHADMIYPVNYGYLEHTISGDGMEIDAYVIGETEVLETFTGYVIGIVERADDNEDKLIVSSDKGYTKDEMYHAVKFTEQYFKSTIITNDDSIEWMHHRLNLIYCMSLKAQALLSADYDVCSLNCIKLYNKEHIQYYGIPVVTYKTVDIGFNIDHIFLESFLTKEQAAEWIKSYTGSYNYQIYGGLNCEALSPETINKCSDDTIGLSIYIPYTDFSHEYLKMWLKEYFKI